jgi:hypothetical protein
MGKNSDRVIEITVVIEEEKAAEAVAVVMKKLSETDCSEPYITISKADESVTETSYSIRSSYVQ